MTAKDYEEVWAILRWDGFHDPPVEPTVFVTVKEVLRSKELAQAEVARLNALVEGREVRYWAQWTRLFPEGKAAGSDVV